MTLTMRLKPALLFLLPVIFSLSTAAAQDRLDPVGMGKARASVASSRGLGALVSNPGALDLQATSRLPLDQDLTVSLYNFGGTIGSTYLSSGDFQDIFGRTTGWPDQADRRRLAELLQDERLFANAANNLLEARYKTEGGGTFGISYGHRLYARLNFPEEFTRVLASGELLAEQYRFINRGIGVSWNTELGISYGKALWEKREGWFSSVGIGATVKLIQGVGQFSVDDNSIITVEQKTIGGTRSYQIQGGYQIRSSQPDDFDPADAVSQFLSGLFPSGAGIGIGGDFGVSGVLYRRSGLGNPANADAIYFGLAAQNIGRITWDGNNYLRSQNGINDTLRNAALDNDRFRSYQGTLRRTGEYATSIPSVVRAGLAVNVNSFASEMETPLMVEIEGEVPLNTVPGNTFDPRLSLGADWQANDWLAVRAGLSGGGVSGFGLGLGVGVRPLDWLTVDVGSGELDALLGGERMELAIRVAAGFDLD